MAEQTAVAIQQGKKALVGGLSWQPLTSNSYSAKVAEIRQLADRIDARQLVTLKTATGEYIGLYNFDPDLSDEVRTKQAYSLASAFANKLSGQSAILVFRLETGERRGDFAVVVIDQGAPSLDMVADEAEALSTVQTYQDSLENAPPYPVYSNVDLPGGRVKPLAADFFQDGFTAKNQLKGLPADVIKLSAVLVGALVLLGGVYGLNVYLEESARQEQLAKIQAMSKLPLYLKQLDTSKTRIGFRSPDVQQLLNQLESQPVVARGWVLSKIQCVESKCTSLWNSRGGYTTELVSFLNHQTPEPDKKNTKTLRFGFPHRLKFQGEPELSRLPKKSTVSNLVFSEQQAWEKSGLGNKATAVGSVWPTGYADIPENEAVYAYPLKLRGSLPLINDFLARYTEGVFWNAVSIDIDTDNLVKAVTVELEGAFYAY